MKLIDYVLIVGVIVGACLVLSRIQTRPETKLVLPSGTCKLVAVTPDGTKVYRIEGPEMVVPAVLAVSPGGQVAFR